MKYISIFAVLLITPATWSPAADPPAYAEAYERVIALEKAGDHIGALRAIPAVYEEEIPVDAFYKTLEQARIALLAILEDDDAVVLGKEEYEVQALRQYFAMVMAGRGETFELNPPPADPYPADRFLYLMIAAGRKHPFSLGNALLEYAAPHIDPATALKKMDPWLVSGAIFFARKAMPESITAQDVVDRWEARPDLWDDICRQEALLFLATQPKKMVEKLAFSRDEIREAVAVVLQPSDGKSAIRPVFILSHTGESMKYPPSSIELCRMERVDGELKTVETRTVRTDALADGWLEVEPGYYMIKHNSVSGSPPSGMYGGSGVVEIKPGQKADVRVRLTPAI